MTVEALLKQLEEEKRMYSEMAHDDYHKMKEYIASGDFGTAAHHEYLCGQENGTAWRLGLAIDIIKARVS